MIDIDFLPYLGHLVGLPRGPEIFGGFEEFILGARFGEILVDPDPRNALIWYALILTALFFHRSSGMSIRKGKFNCVSQPPLRLLNEFSPK
jgi:hypothetical protein